MEMSLNAFSKMKYRWRAYIPALGAFGVGLFFLAVPALAVFLVCGALFSFALFYAFIVAKIHQAQDRSQSSTGFNQGQGSEPNFRNVTFRMQKDLRWFRDLN